MLMYGVDTQQHKWEGLGSNACIRTETYQAVSEASTGVPWEVLRSALVVFNSEISVADNEMINDSHLTVTQQAIKHILLPKLMLLLSSLWPCAR